MPSTTLQFELSGPFADFVNRCVGYGESADAKSFIENLLKQEENRRTQSLEQELLAALDGDQFEISSEELRNEHAWEILQSKEALPRNERILP